MKSNNENNQNAVERFMYGMFIRRRILILFLSVVSVLLYFFHIHIPLLPKFFTIEFSAFPELLLTFAYGPLYGVIMCLIKNIIHSVATGNTVIPGVSNFITEAVFLIVAGITSPRISERVAAKNKGVVSTPKRLGIKSFASLMAIIAELITQFAVTNLFVYPLLIKSYPQAYSKSVFLQSYNAALEGIQSHLPSFFGNLIPKINYVWQGVLFVNIPITFIKLLVIAFLTMLIYFLILPLLFQTGRNLT